MFENETKGWYGSYSTVGRNSAEKYPMIIQKEKILKDQCQKKPIKNYFTTNDDKENLKLAIEDTEDIFSQNTKRRTKKSKKKKVNEICDHGTKKNIPDEYKYHQLHHQELYNYNLLMKKQNCVLNSIYAPKKSFIMSRTLTGPCWNIITGREKNGFFDKKIVFTDKIYIDHDNTDIKNNMGGVPMNKQTKRGILPTSYDLRIRTDEPFEKSNKNKDNKNNTINNFLKKSYVESNKNLKNEFKKKFLKKQKKNHSISFAKTISREQYNYLHRDRRGARPFFNPNYTLVEPRSLVMVTYASNKKDKSFCKRLDGISSNLFYEPDKVIDKINNNKIPSVPNFKLMEERSDKNNILPVHMNKMYSRGALEVITDKGLKMNNFSQGAITEDISTFSPKKTFNSVINYKLLKNCKSENKRLMGITKKLSTLTKLKNLMEFYTKNLDDENVELNSKFDAITYRTVRSNAVLSERDKKLFSLKFTE